MNSLLTRFALTAVLLIGGAMTNSAAERFDGEFFTGEGDIEYLQLLDIARRMFSVDPEFQNVAMLYMPAWNGLVEGPTWGAWWIQNSYGPTYCALPFYQEPFVTFLQNSHDLWFDQMGDGKRSGAKDWVAPDGCLCDAASPGWIVYKQGDGRTDIHDWGMEFTAAGLLMQAELLLVSRDADAIARHLPKLERCAAFIETRRDPENNLFLAGPAGNLLAPSYAGWKRPDATYDKAYLTGLSITYIAALDRLIELEKLAGDGGKASLYTDRRDRARAGLAQVTTGEGYFIKSLDPDGTRHGVYGAEKHGYFESSPNHDAIAFRVVDDDQAEKIYEKIASIAGLRRHSVIIANEPGLDDMYDPGTSWLWTHGTWVNGGHWSTCEARMVLAYYRLGKYDDARRSMEHMLTFARRFRMDNPLVDFGSKVYQPKEPINLCYDSFGPPAALIRGLFEYLYRADDLTLIPHIPRAITRLEQRFPIRFGSKKLYLATVGTGPVTAVRINGKPWTDFNPKTVRLPYDNLPDTARIQIALGETDLDKAPPFSVEDRSVEAPPEADPVWDVAPILRAWGTNRLPLRIGADSNGSNGFVGDIGRVRIFGRALNEEEVAVLARNEPPSVDRDPALVADWTFDCLQDGVFPNVPSHDLPAKIVGDAEIVGAPDGKALRLSGVGWAEVAHDPKLDLTEAFTLEAWICPGDLPETGARIIDKIPAGTDTGYLLDMCPGKALRVITNQGTLTHNAGLTPGQWCHVAATFDAGGELRLYVNGEPAAVGLCETPQRLPSFERLRTFYAQLLEGDLGQSYEARHAALVIDSIAAIWRRRHMLGEGAIQLLPEPSQSAADKAYADTAVKLCQGLETVLDSYSDASDPHRSRIRGIWLASHKPPPSGP